jgi:hypothetical protein
VRERKVERWRDRKTESKKGAFGETNFRNTVRVERERESLYLKTFCNLLSNRPRSQKLPFFLSLSLSLKHTHTRTHTHTHTHTHTYILDLLCLSYFAYDRQAIVCQLSLTVWLLTSISNWKIQIQSQRNVIRN